MKFAAVLSAAGETASLRSGFDFAQIVAKTDRKRKPMEEKCRYCGGQFQDLETVMQHQESGCAVRNTMTKEVWISLLKEKDRSGRKTNGAKARARRYVRNAYI